MIKPVSYATILDDPNWHALHAAYDAECAIAELGPSEPQPELYQLLEKSGGFQAFGVYDGEALVGFAAVLIYVLPHYGKKIATTESIFVREKDRDMRGLGLLEFVEKYAKENLCSALLYSAPHGSRFDRMMSGSSYFRHTNNVYLRTL